MSDKYMRYHKVAKIGSGGMGDVYRVIDVDLGRECAMKCVPLQVAVDGELEGVEPSGRLLREVSIMTGVQDPNVVLILDQFQHENQLCIVMELCQISVADWVNQREPFSLLTTLEMGEQILSALTVVHESGVIHRDIKPHNILISANGKQFKLTDFGLASLRDASMVLTQSGVFAGTIAFMSPEQRLSFKGVLPQGDLYSLAMTMQWTLFGELRGDLFSSRTSEILSKEIQDRGWPSELLAFFSKAGHEDPLQRYATAEDMRRDVLKILQSLDGSRYTRLTPADFQSVHRFESKLSSSTKPVSRQDSQSTEELQAETNRWLRVLLFGLASLFVVLLAVGYQVIQIASPIEQPQQPIVKASIPECEDIVETQHQYRKLGPRETQSATLKDVDGDGFQDAVYVNQLDKNLSIYWGSPAADFDSVTEYSIGRAFGAPLIGDINRDGLLDMVTLHSDESMIRTHLQQEARIFEQSVEVFQGPPPIDGALMDINRDGWLDVVFTVPGLDLNVQYRLGSAEGFGAHTSLVDVPNPIFVSERNQLVYWSEGTVMRREIKTNLSLSTPQIVAEMDDVQSILPMRMKDGDVLLYAKVATGDLIRLGPNPCVAMNLSTNEFSRVTGLGDWNQDGYLDWVGFVTCAGCTSNHLLYLGGPPSIQSIED